MKIFPTMFTTFMILLSACSEDDDTPASKQTYFPPLVDNNDWERVSPASLGWDVSKLPTLQTFLLDNNTRAFIILKDGKIAVEEYFGKQFDGVTNFGVNSNWYWASAGKTLTSVLIGIAQSQGKINFDATSATYLGQGWTSLSTTQENKITVRHHLTMTTGLNDEVANKDCTTPSCFVYKAEPGTRWAYHNGPYTVLDKVIENGTGQTLNNFLQAQVQIKIGMSGMYIKTGDNNVYYSTARSMARFGLLLLNKGRWNDDTIFPESYYTLLSNSSQSINPSYGYLSWLNGKSTSMIPSSQVVFNSEISPNAPDDLFAAMGKNGQLINVVPGKGLVIIRMGDAPDQSLVPFTFQNDLWAQLNTLIK